jgi:peptidoglycan-N-acetylglucosamine deacetylase
MVRNHLYLDVPMAAAAISLSVGLHSNVPLAAIGLASTAIHAWATIHPRSSLYLRVHWRLPAGTSDVALTFDDGPHPETTPAILDALAVHDQRATFFVIGEHVRRHADVLRRIVAAGHSVGLHSDSHSRWFNCWPRGKVQRDLAACAATIADATGAPPPRLFRPPVGLKNPLVGDIARRMGLVAVTWSSRGWDTRTSDVERIADAIGRAARPRSIIMLHDGHEPGRAADRSATVAALRRALPGLAERGIRSRALIVSGDGIALAA